MRKYLIDYPDLMYVEIAASLSSQLHEPPYVLFRDCIWIALAEPDLRNKKDEVVPCPWLPVRFEGYMADDEPDDPKELWRKLGL